ncbi:hypothetical protein H310_09578 [Aphanomyces invadans]|uniref:SET domain-containing protein n=1 Tax=Aphanomyces invadans TaxID=157072 RepID=A0A024TUJ3_9STRA|nr:hypothetical protein H310_09578 [Aphanomyces invadans]ETV97693.1 hypothetical protein H310_09578 [Aphanomyces invadans]|eukprot:XP_008873902.1 hypothetical protein H310_09578 [Aphanomyces invadans]
MAIKRMRPGNGHEDLTRVLHFLPLSSVSNLAQTSAAWHAIVLKYHRSMEHDLSGGLDQLRVTVVNTVDSERYPVGFTYQASTRASSSSLDLPPPLHRHVHVEVFKQDRTGWSVRCTEDIPASAFIGEYVGQLVRTATMDRTSRYIVSIREEAEDTVWRTNVDARHVGNFTRFINHSCSPNARWDTYRSPMTFCPRIHVLSLREIKAGEEITVDYGADHGIGSIPCHCGSDRCRRYLPFDRTL